MRRGFSLIAAIVFIILIATIAISALSYATLTAKTTRDVYLKEQAKLLAQSATEYAVMVMQSHDYTKAGCPQVINLTYPDAVSPMFNITIRLRYIDSNLNAAAGCNTIGRHNSSLAANSPNLLSARTNSAIVDVEVVSAGNVAGPVVAQAAGSNVQVNRIRYTRRTLQKP